MLNAFSFYFLFEYKLINFAKKKNLKETTVSIYQIISVCLTWIRVLDDLYASVKYNDGILLFDVVFKSRVQILLTIQIYNWE